MRSTHRLALFLTLALAAPTHALQPASALNHHMVLQRGKAAPIWGTADAGEKITVRFAGQTVATCARQGVRTIDTSHPAPGTLSYFLTDHTSTGSVQAPAQPWPSWLPAEASSAKRAICLLALCAMT